MEEIWRDIKDYEGMYQVSNLGRVKCLDRIDSAGRKRYGRILKLWNSRGYLQVGLSINSKGKKFSVHRLVAQAFIKNPNNKLEVNHKDEDKTNNRVDNLEWVTSKENSNWGTGIERSAKNRSKRIKVIYRDNTYEYWDSAAEFARDFRIDQRRINNVLRGRRKTAAGMKFEYA